MTVLGPVVGVGRTSKVYEFGAGSVIKVLRSGVPDRWAAMEAEFTTAVRSIGLPTPLVRDLVRVDGRPGIVFERVDGPSMWAEMVATPRSVVPLARELATIHLAIHQELAPSALPDLIGRVSEKIGSAELLSETERSDAQKVAAGMDRGADLHHGDLHPGNIVMTAEGPVVIDWFDAASGDPLADIVRTSLLLRPPRNPSLTPQHLPGATRSLLCQAHLGYVHRVMANRTVSAALVRSWEAVLAASRLAERTQQDEAELASLWRGRHRPASSPLIEELEALGIFDDDNRQQ